MADAQAYDYDTRLNVLCQPLETIDLHAIAGGVTHPWFNQTLCQVNDSVVRMGVVKGEYHWHKHDADDEFFYVVEGEFLIDLEDQTIALQPGQGCVIPRGRLHRPRAPGRTIVLMVETSSIVPTGDPS
jgi:mannose-6-phosphate isomerase-like protein (cupin superfamily)